MKNSILLLLAFFLVSCASVTKQQMAEQAKNYNLPFQPNKDEGIVYVLRPSYLGTIVRFNVFYNQASENAEIGWTRGGQYVYFFAKPGEHVFYSSAENTASIKVKVDAGKATFIKQEPTMGFIMARNNLYEVDEVEAKYHLMKLTTGNIIMTRTAEEKKDRLPASKK